MSTGTRCSVYLEGELLPDGSPGDPPADVVALSELVVTWGRDTTVDQPAPATCSFSVTGSAGESLFDTFGTGRHIGVTATGVDYPSPSTSTFLDPSFESDPIAAYPSNATVAPDVDVVLDGLRSLRIVPTNPSRGWSTILSPAPVVPAGTNPAAWDAIAKTSLGQTWDAGAWVYAPPGVTLTVRPVLFSGPWLASAVPADLPWSYVGPGWVYVHTLFVPEVADRWVGLELAAYPTGPSWTDLGFASPGQAWTDLDPAWTWADYVAVYVDEVVVLSPAEGTERTVLVFAGRITNLDTTWDDGLARPRLDVVAADFTADLANVDVGDEPWVVETMAERFARILELAEVDVTAEIAPALGSLLVSWLDVDSRPAAGLLADLATSVDGVLWAATHITTGAYYLVEDPAGRASLYRLELGEDGLVDVVVATSTRPLSACDVLRDPIAYRQDVSDVVTRAAVSWQEQTVDEDGLPAPTERTETLIDTALEAIYGTRRISVSTQLQAREDAIGVAERLLARLTADSWRAGGFVVDDDDLGEDAELLLDLLDGTRRIGLALSLVDLPAWSPAGDEVPLYLEAGTYRFTEGRWVLELAISSPRGLGASLPWIDLDPAWTWAEFDPALAWVDLAGVAGPSAQEAA